MRSFLLALLMMVAAGCQHVERFEFTRLCMGVRTEVVVYAEGRERAEIAAQAAFERINEIDAEMSDYRRDSVLSRLNASGGSEALAVSEDFLRVLAEAARVSEASDGAFDVTAGPAVRLWREARDTGQLPTMVQRRLARQRIDWREVVVDASARTVRLPAGMGLDFGGVAKGFAAEEAVKRLRALGFGRSMVALGGDVFVGDAPPGMEGWRVDVGGRTILVRDAAVSTSGDEQQFVEIGGARYAHIVDPRTGLGATMRRRVTTVGAHGALVDAAATAAFLVGTGAAERLGGMGVIVEEGGEVRVADPQGFVRWAR